jgi:hypothetical protein
MLTTDRIAHLIADYAGGPARLEAAVAGLPQDELVFKPGPEHWSIHENVIHVTDMDLNAAARIRHILGRPGATLIGVDQEAWGRMMDYASQPLAESLALLRAIRAATTPILRRMPPEAWEYTGAHNEYGPQTVEWIVNHFAEHIDYHLNTIAKRRRQYAESRRA